ncbi:MAG: aminoacyl-tRNA hydrolase [Pirellulales bacterium]|nr:aminoacyl-tRNA hydrolase [Pirellulales bacterium]
MLNINSRIQVPLSELHFTFSRSSGPGGQNVNKVNTKATLRWPVVGSPSLPDDVRERFLSRFRNRITSEGDLVMASQRFRDAGRNAGDCVEKLRQMLTAVASPPKPRKRTKPSRASIRRRLADKRKQSEKKHSRGGEW